MSHLIILAKFPLNAVCHLRCTAHDVMQSAKLIPSWRLMLTLAMGSGGKGASRHARPGDLLQHVSRRPGRPLLPGLAQN